MTRVVGKALEYLPFHVIEQQQEEEEEEEKEQNSMISHHFGSSSPSRISSKTTTTIKNFLPILTCTKSILYAMTPRICKHGFITLSLFKLFSTHVPTFCFTSTLSFKYNNTICSPNNNNNNNNNNNSDSTEISANIASNILINSSLLKSVLNNNNNLSSEATLTHLKSLNFVNFAVTLNFSKNNNRIRFLDEEQGEVEVQRSGLHFMFYIAFCTPHLISCSFQNEERKDNLRLGVGGIVGFSTTTQTEQQLLELIQVKSSVLMLFLLLFHQNQDVRASAASEFCILCREFDLKARKQNSGRRANSLFKSVCADNAFLHDGVAKILDFSKENKEEYHLLKQVTNLSGIEKLEKEFQSVGGKNNSNNDNTSSAAASSATNNNNSNKNLIIKRLCFLLEDEFCSSHSAYYLFAIREIIHFNDDISQRENIIEEVLPLVSDFLQSDKTIHVIEALYLLSNALEGSDEVMEAAADSEMGIVEQVMKILKESVEKMKFEYEKFYSSEEVVIEDVKNNINNNNIKFNVQLESVLYASLRVCGNFSISDNEEIEKPVLSDDYGLIDEILEFLSRVPKNKILREREENRQIRKEACWILSNFVGSQREKIYTEKIIQNLVENVYCTSSPVASREAAYSLANMMRIERNIDEETQLKYCQKLTKNSGVIECCLFFLSQMNTSNCSRPWSDTCAWIVDGIPILLNNEKRLIEKKKQEFYREQKEKQEEEENEEAGGEEENDFIIYSEQTIRMIRKEPIINLITRVQSLFPQHVQVGRFRTAIDELFKPKRK